MRGHNKMSISDDLEMRTDLATDSQLRTYIFWQNEAVITVYVHVSVGLQAFSSQVRCQMKLCVRTIFFFFFCIKKPGMKPPVPIKFFPSCCDPSSKTFFFNPHCNKFNYYKLIAFSFQKCACRPKNKNNFSN